MSDELIEKLKDAQKRYGVMQVVSVNAGGSGDIDKVVVAPLPVIHMRGTGSIQAYEIQLVEG